MHKITVFSYCILDDRLLSDQAGDLMVTEISDAQSGKTPAAVIPAATDFRAEVLRLVNLEREKAGVRALIEQSALRIPADIRARESSDLFSHTRPDGTRCFTVFAEHSLIYRAAGENLAYGFKTPVSAVNAWMKSKGHRRNIIDPVFKYSGIGYFADQKGKIYCAQLFFTPKAVQQ
jgi:uncharacterized protein YkwD